MSDHNFFSELKRRNVYKVAVAYDWDKLRGDPRFEKLCQEPNN